MRLERQAGLNRGEAGCQAKGYKQGMICLILEFGKINKQLHDKCGNGGDRHWKFSSGGY